MTGQAFGPSDGALAFRADPANWDTRGADPALIPGLRAEGRAAGRAAAADLASDLGVVLSETRLGGVRCLEITPQRMLGSGSLLYLFGGGFVVGSPEEDLPIAARLAVQSGRVTIAPEYGLAPERPYPAGLNDAISVAETLAARGRWCIAGESAGANLALGVVGRLGARGMWPRAVALMSPAADLAETGHGTGERRDPTINPDFAAAVPGLYAPDADLTSPWISPIHLPFAPTWPPTVITTGTHDHFLSACARLARAMRSQGAPVDLRVWDGMWHVFEFYADIPEAAASLAELAAFLASQMDD